MTKRVGYRNDRSFQSQSPVKVLGMDLDPLCHLNCSEEKGYYRAGQLIAGWPRKMRNNEKYSRNFFHKFLDVHLEKEWGTPRFLVPKKRFRIYQKTYGEMALAKIAADSYL